MRIWKLLVILCLTLTVAACGGGGGGTPAPAPAPTTKAYKLVLQGSNTSGGAGGMQFQVVIPAGVTLNVSSNNEITTSSLFPSGAVPTNTPLFGGLANSTATIVVAPIPPAKINDGEFATLVCNITQGSAPAASSFTVQNVQVLDTSLNPAVIPGATVVLQDT